MAKQVLSVRVDEDVISKVNYYCGVLGISQAEFITSAIDVMCEETSLERHGGAKITLPNPQIFQYTNEQAVNVVSVISAAANEITRECPSLDFGLNGITAYAVQRLFKDSEKQKKQFEENLYADLANEDKNNGEGI